LSVNCRLIAKEKNEKKNVKFQIQLAIVSLSIDHWPPA